MSRSWMGTRTVKAEAVVSDELVGRPRLIFLRDISTESGVPRGSFPRLAPSPPGFATIQHGLPARPALRPDREHDARAANLYLPGHRHVGGRANDRLRLPR